MAEEAVKKENKQKILSGAMDSGERSGDKVWRSCVGQRRRWGAGAVREEQA